MDVSSGTSRTLPTTTTICCSSPEVNSTEERTVQYKASGNQTSLFEETKERCMDEATMMTLDSLRTRLPAPADFLKLDVQGFELQVLKGSTETLRSCDAVLLEVSFFPFLN